MIVVDRPPAAPLAADGAEPRDDGPRRLRRYAITDLFELAGSALGGVCLAWLTLYRFGPLEGWLGFLICWYVGFVAVYTFVVIEGHGVLAARDRLSTVLVASAGGLTVLPLIFVLSYVVSEGVEAASHWNFFSDDMAATGGADPLTSGGIKHALIGTLEQVGIALLICVPLAVGTAVYLNEVRGRFAGAVRFFVNAMSGVPSIVAGLFLFSALVLGRGYSGFAAALALSILMLPTIARTSEEVLRLVPGGLREAALALGAPEWRVVMRVVLPTARSGVVTAIILGTARIAGEAAPPLLTAFGGTSVNTDPFEGNQDSLPLTVYSLIRQPNGNQQARAWGTALVLMALILVLFALARKVGSRRPGSAGLTSRLVRRVRSSK